MSKTSRLNRPNNHSNNPVRVQLETLFDGPISFKRSAIFALLVFLFSIFTAKGFMWDLAWTKIIAVVAITQVHNSVVAAIVTRIFGRIKLRDL